MTWYKTGFCALIMGLFIEGCAGSGQVSETWPAKDRSSLRGRNITGTFVERLISVPLDSNKLDDGYFDLYYYSLVPVNFDEIEKKTVLFVAGGPGQINRHFVDADTHVNFFFNHGYQVVFFHLRGSGFSQVQSSTHFDRFIRTRHAVNDIEAIREDLKRQKLLGTNGKWNAIVGWSYGTILAQQYAKQYQTHVEKLVLIGPQSRHMFVRPRKSYKDELDELNRKERETLRDSFNRVLEEVPEFSATAGETERNVIVDKVFGSSQDRIFNRTRDLFGNIQFVIENYCDFQDELQSNKLDYSRQFFQNLRTLGRLGSLPKNDETRRIGKALVNELRQGPQNDKSCIQPIEEEQENHRTFFVMTVYDGINASFLKEWLGSERNDFRGSLKRSAGTARLVPYVDKVGIAKDLSVIKAWTPSEYSHSVPTLVLKGGGDPVSSGGAAEEFYNEGTAGPRTFIEFPEVGHDFALPRATDLGWDGIVTFNFVDLLQNRPVPVTGTMVGSKKIDPKFKLILEPSKNTEYRHSLKLLGFGVLKGELVSDDRKSRENIGALFENTGTKTLEGTTDWVIKNPEFEASVRFVFKEPLKPKETAMLSGTIIGGHRVSTTHIEIQPVNEAEPSNPNLKVPCIRVLNENKVEAWFHNQGTVRNQPIRANEGMRISFANGETTKTVEVKVNQLLEPGSGTVEQFTVHGVKLGVPDHRVEMMEIEDPADKRIFACVPREETIGANLTMILRNDNSGRTWESEENRIWIITNEVFTAYLNVAKKVKIPPKSMVEVNATVVGVRVNSALTLQRPQGSRGEIDWLTTNAVGENQVSVLVKRGVGTLDGTEDWTYNMASPETGVCENPEKLLSCLLYSFIDMDTSRFRTNGISSVILNIIKKTFLPHTPTIKHCSGPADKPENCKIVAQ